LRIILVGAFVAAAAAPLTPAAAATTSCGQSGGHTLCITVPTSPLTGVATIGVTNSPNGGKMTVFWQTGSTSVQLLTRSGPSGTTEDYSFVWPTTKYLDASGTLKAKIGSGAFVSAAAQLSNGNVGGIQHTLNDWQSYLPGPWTAPTDPVVAAVGDGPDDSAVANGVAASIANANPALFLFLGDVYENGTYTELRTMYGASSLDGSGTLWGTLATITQPTIGNHEHKHLADVTDYWHGRPTFTSFTFGGVLFLDLYSSASMQPGSPQYAFVQTELQDAPACIVPFFHIPALSGGTIASNKSALWNLLASNGADVVINGHNHFMMEYEPLAGDLTSPGHMVELISGAGGHALGPAKSDPGGRIAWSLGKTPGALYLTLQGAASGGVATAIGWRFETSNGTVVRTGSVTC
jgi:hypothetical protein